METTWSFEVTKTGLLKKDGKTFSWSLNNSTFVGINPHSLKANKPSHPIEDCQCIPRTAVINKAI